MYRYRDNIIKWLKYSLFLILLTLTQEFLLSRLRIFNIMPVLGGVLTATVAMFEGGVAGAVFGAVTGFAGSGLAGGGEILHALCYFFGGLATGELCSYMFRKGLLTAFLWSLAVTLVTSLLYFLFFYLVPYGVSVRQIIFTVLPETLYSLLFIPVVYFPVREISRAAEGAPEV